MVSERKRVLTGLHAVAPVSEFFASDFIRTPQTENLKPYPKDSPMFHRKPFIDAVIFATLAGLLLSAVVGCAGTTAASVARGIKLAERSAKTAPVSPR